MGPDTMPSVPSWSTSSPGPLLALSHSYAGAHAGRTLGESLELMAHRRLDPVKGCRYAPSWYLTNSFVFSFPEGEGL